MQDQKTGLLQQFYRFQSHLRIRSVLFADTAPEVSTPRDMLPSPRLLIPLAGDMRLHFTLGGQIVHRKLEPGTVLFVPSLSFTRSDWSTPHEMLSLVLREQHLRMLYIKHINITDNPMSGPIPNAMFHIADYNKLIRDIFSLLNELGLDGDNVCAIKFVECLLRLSIADLSRANVEDDNKRVYCPEWSRILEYAHQKAVEGIGREEVARTFRLSPQYISRLFRRNTSMTFNAYITSEKMNHAAELLNQTGMTIDEIASECGYEYASYFIRVFNKSFGMSPGEYRKRKQTNTDSTGRNL